MEELVFVNQGNSKKEPFTTSDIIAKYAGISYRSIQRLIEKQENALSKFGRVRFEITPFETKGGTQNKKIYHLNEEQATLLITFLKNTEPVVAFKSELVRQFYTMKTELIKCQVLREAGKPIRRALTDAIRDNPAHSPYDYKHYTDLAYKMATGKTAAQLRRERGMTSKSNATNLLNSSELFHYERVENQIAVLIDLGMEYEQIKAVLTKTKVIEGGEPCGAYAND